MTRASIIVPAYNVAHCIRQTLDSLLAQTCTDYEIVVVDDGATDNTVEIVQSYDDPRIRLVRQTNRGLAGARNSGIDAARGAYIGFCDADDLWHPEKLECHIAHLELNPGLGVSYSGSAMIDDDGRPMGMSQRPKLQRITPEDVLLRNPIGNGSAPVFRRAALEDIRYRPEGETVRDWWFDETFRQSEDIECWTRFALTTSWDMAGIEADLTLYRISARGLSASVTRQLESWERMAAKITGIDPEFAARHMADARAYQLRYLARRAVSMGQGRLALDLALRSLRVSRHPMRHEPRKTLTTLAAALVQTVIGARAFSSVMGVARKRAA